MQRHCIRSTVGAAVRGASANPAHLIGANQGITPAHQQAAERLMDDFALGVCGARSERGWLIEVRAPSRGGYPPGDARLDRVRRYQRAMAALGQYERIAINWMVRKTLRRSRLI
jgi:hypothetical protein